MRNAEACWQQASDFFNLKQYGDTVAVARDGLAASPDDARLWQLLGIALWHLGLIEEAESALETASILVPLRPWSRRVLAECYARGGKRSLAVFMLRRLLRDGSCPTELISGIAASLHRLKCDRLALEACRLLVHRDPQRHSAHFAIAFYRHRLGAPPRALVASLRLAVELAPHLLHYKLNLASVLAEIGRPRHAQRILAPVNLQNICWPAWVRRMGAIFAAAGDHARATECVQQLRRLARGQCARDSV